jgi:hypothetical protein
MPTFNTNLELGSVAFGVSGGLDFYVQKLTVGQVRVVRTLPRYSQYTHDGCYKEEYMCVETGVGSGTVWEYGKNIFKYENDAERSVIKHQQEAYKQRAARDEHKAEVEKQKRENDLRMLEDLKKKYEVDNA